MKLDPLPLNTVKAGRSSFLHLFNPTPHDQSIVVVVGFLLDRLLSVIVISGKSTDS